MLIIVIPVVLLGAMMWYGSTIPDYKIEAIGREEACHALYDTQTWDPPGYADRECQRIYDETIAAGKASNAK